MNIKNKWGVMAALLALLLAAPVYAQDNGTEFGIEDDLTVLGTQGTALDPDAEVKGFTVFGATQSAYTGAVVGAGNVVVNGVLAVSSGIYSVANSTFAAGSYFMGGSTFSSGAYFTGVSSFSTVANVHFGGGVAGQVLKKVAGGGMVWANDSVGAGDISGISRRIVMFHTSGTGAMNSLLQQDADDLGITMLTGSSLTIRGAFLATGAARFDGPVTLGDAAGDAITSVGALTAQNGLAVTGSNASITNNLTVNGNAQLGDAVSDTHAVNRAPEAGVALAVDGGGAAGNFAAKFYSNGSLAAWIKKK